MKFIKTDQNFTKKQRKSIHRKGTIDICYSPAEQIWFKMRKVSHRLWIMKTKHKNGAREGLHVIIRSCYNQCHWHHVDPLTCAFLPFTLFSEFILKYWTNWEEGHRDLQESKRHNNNQYNCNKGKALHAATLWHVAKDGPCDQT